jgi:(2Fe-2S) ferredoxin
MIDTALSTVFVCTNIDCKNRGSKGVLDALRAQRAAAGLPVRVEPYICFSACNIGPNVVIASKRCWFSSVQPQDCPEIVEYIAGGADIPRLKVNNEADLEELIFGIIDAGLIPDAG